MELNDNNVSSDLLLSHLKRERPVCFRPEEFFEENFNVDAFLSLNRKSFTLDSLKKDLENYSTTIQNSLVELINRDYADFVNLSTNLVGVDQSILKLEAPLISIKADVDIIKKSIESEIICISDKLEQRNSIKNKQDVLHSFLKIQEITEKVEKLIDCNAGGNENLFERVAREYSQLKFYVNKYEDTSFVKNISPRIKKISDYLESGLYISFTEGLQNNDRNTVTQCLRVFTTLGRVDKSEQLYAETLISPLIDKLISREIYQRQGLSAIYSSLLAALPDATDLVLSLTIPSNENELKAFDFCSNAVFPAIVSKICTKLPAIFGAGDAQQFHKNYNETIKFIGKFEKLCQYKERVTNLRNHPSYKTFLSKWSLPIYFQIRLQEIAGSFEYQTLTALTQDKAYTHPDFYLPLSEMLVMCLSRVWDDSVFLKPLAHRSFKLSLQFIKRYRIWAASLPSESSELVLADLTKVVYDIVKLSNQIPEVLLNLVKDKIPTSSETESMINLSCSDLLSAIPYIQEYVERIVLSQCTVHTDSVQEVPRLYRRTNKPMPTEALPYVSELVQPIKGEIYSSILPEVYKREWCRNTAKQLSTCYHKAVADILVSLKKTEDSLAMLKRGRRQASTTSIPTPSIVSDEEKTRTQLRLDIKVFIELFTEMGIDDVEEFDSLTTLVSAQGGK